MKGSSAVLGAVKGVRSDKKYEDHCFMRYGVIFRVAVKCEFSLFCLWLK